VKLGLNTGYWSAGPPVGTTESIAEAERLGFDSVWTAEAYGSDCFTPLAWWGASTSRLRLGTAVAQMSARTPTATAMAALTLDHLSGGRVIVGIGASGPQVVECWYGQPYPRPLERTREYIEIMRAVFRREEPVAFEGRHYQLPAAGGTGLGKPLRSTVHPLRPDLPVFLGAEGPKNVALAAEIADGWLPLFFSPKSDGFYREAMQAGFAKRSSGLRTSAAFEVTATVPLVPVPDVEAAADMIRPMLALYIGGMGARGANFHYEVFARMGWEGECAKIQELYLDGQKGDAIAAVPTAMVEDVALIGPPDKLADDLERWKSTVITTMLVSGPPQMLQTAAELVLA
jgi:F420-dependent oxidoreductase-like protein